VNKLNFGDIVFLKFPFTDGKTYKRRPALVITDSNDGDIIVCRITSKIYNSKQDVLINDWKNCGLKLPSIIRIHKIATLEKELVELVIGEIDNPLKIKIKTILANIPE
jgi:mRNA interferase MazF